MSTNFYPLMRAAYLAHQEFHLVWKKYYTNTKKVEPSEVTEARDLFNVANDNLFRELNEYERGFFDGEPKAINSILNFLEVDFPAFRCGYAKEKFYRRLKSIQLDREQIERLRTIAYKQCESDYYRREFRELARLMIKLADQDLIERLSDLARSSEGLVKFKSNRMLESILQNRKHLQ